MAAICSSKGAVGIAKKCGISAAVIGLTVVAFGTSAPEMIVSIHAAFTNHGDIAVGNVVRSNITNILLVIGTTTRIYPIATQNKWHNATAALCCLSPCWYVIGVTIVAVGTSVPEFFASVMAAYRRHADIALGNVVGSNIFNVSSVIGSAAIVNPCQSQGYFCDWISQSWQE